MSETSCFVFVCCLGNKEAANHSFAGHYRTMPGQVKTFLAGFFVVSRQVNAGKDFTHEKQSCSHALRLSPRRQSRTQLPRRSYILSKYIGKRLRLRVYCAKSNMSCGCSIVVMRWLPKPVMRVRFPSAASKKRGF